MCCIPKVEDACRDCSGLIACQACHDDEYLKCCISDGESRGRCCAVASPEFQARTSCKVALLAEHLFLNESAVDSVKDYIRTHGWRTEMEANIIAAEATRQHCDPASLEDACLNCTGDACQQCRMEQHVKCCLSMPGASRSTCCPKVSPEMQAWPLCRVNLVAAVRKACTTEAMEAPCKGCQGAACYKCYEEQDVRCCIREGGPVDLCCNDASPELRSQPLCGHVAEILP